MLIRENLGNMTIEQLSRACSIEIEDLECLQSGEKYPTSIQTLKIANALNVKTYRLFRSLDEILGNLGIEKKDGWESKVLHMLGTGQIGFSLAAEIFEISCSELDKILQHSKQKLSPALMEMAKREIEELEEASDRAFLIRMEMDRKLTSL